MAVHKIILDDDLGEEYSLLAIHCSEEPFKLAFLLNKYLQLRLKRQAADLEFIVDDTAASFPIFEFVDEFQYTTYYLVSNKCKLKVAQEENAGGLFATLSERTVTKTLLPEFKNVDFFLKIESDFDQVPLRKNIALLNEINQVISAYTVDNESIKSQHHLIFN
ncbi:MAG: IPExxxVDY family protein [Bacteroidetes bacterium]|nr:IPExxxVDY family protein [Bacteroidota bacterium]